MNLKRLMFAFLAVLAIGLLTPLVSHDLFGQDPGCKVTDLLTSAKLHLGFASENYCRTIAETYGTIMADWQCDTQYCNNQLVDCFDTEKLDCLCVQVWQCP